MNRKHLRFILVTLLFIVQVFFAKAQDSLYTRIVIQTLAGNDYHGRGYVKKGDSKAADYIGSQFKKTGLASFTNNYYQKFSFGVNTFPGAMMVSVNGKTLRPGIDYIVYPSSSSSSKSFILREIDSAKTLELLQIESPECLVISNKAFNAIRENAMKALELRSQGAIVIVEDSKLTWSVGRSRLNVPVVIILRKSLPENLQSISFNIKSVFEPSHKTQNVIGYIKGKSMPDSFIVFSAHYDHLGLMGKKTIFPGANDNASGVAMLLNLATHYNDPAHRPECSMLFIAFAGEEAGLVGSHYYTEHPLFPLSQIKFLINLDLLGTGDEGMTVVNATEYKSQFQLLKSINDEKKYLPMIGERGKAKNSDHYYFSEKGVPSFFLYTLGGIKAYHDIDDKESSLPLTRFKEVFQLICNFAERL